MDEVLALRYLTLFFSYGAGERDLEFLKSQLIARTIPSVPALRPLLRADAALLLLSLYDQMILRPYTGPVRLPSGEEISIPETPRHTHDFDGRVRRSLNVILTELERLPGGRAISSHQVLQAILDVWPTVSELYGWA